MCRKPRGRPRSDIRIVTWWSDSGESDQKSHIALGVCCAALPRYGGEAQQAIGFLANFCEDAGLGVLADIVSDSQCAVSSRAFGVDGALGNALAILMCEFFKELVVLHQERSARTGGNGVLVVRDGISRRSGHELGFVDHRLNLRSPNKPPRELLLKYLFPVIMIGIAYG